MEEMGPENRLNAIEELPFEQFTSPISPVATGLCGSPQANTRVGKEYQAEIPPIISESGYQHLVMNPIHSGAVDSSHSNPIHSGAVDSSHSFLGCSVIPITWATHDKVNNRKDDDSVGSSKSSKSKRTCVSKKKGSKMNAESMDVELGEKGSKQANLSAEDLGKGRKGQFDEKKNRFAVPGSQSDPWSDVQVNCFVLGLFIFGKNFVQVKRFMGDKTMGEILSFYYGEFYKSDNYRRWIEHRRIRWRKSVFGRKIFTEWRQQELLSRLHTRIPEHSLQAILEVSAAFTEGKLSLEDYVSNLRATVGVEVLVEAIGIGKGKEDLTSFYMEPGKMNPLFPVCPVGKACASLTSSDIIKLLTGSVRLSKARCNDIFWEAIWPRLLAKGWHSEEASNQGYHDSKHQIVFLIPGVTKFSRRNLVRGNDYFDSVSDVLNKVASEPKLIELESEDGTTISYNEEDGVLGYQDDPSVKSSHHYLKPRVSTSDQNDLKFTVVDSSFEQKGKLSKVREMRYLPDDLKLSFFLPILSSRNKRVFSDSVDKKELDVDIPQVDERNVNTVDCKEVVSDDCGVKKSKLTIVDTSLVHGGRSKVQELRYPEAASQSMFDISKSLTEAERHSSETLPHEHTSVADMVSIGGNNANKFYRRKARRDTSGSNPKELDSIDTREPIEGPRDQRHKENENQQLRTIKHQFSRRLKSDHSNNLDPLMKRRRLIACSNSEINNASEKFFGGPRATQMEPSLALNSLETGSNASQVGPDENKLPSICPFEGCSGNGRSENCSRVEISHVPHMEQPNPSLINLNLPPADSDSDNPEPVSMEVEDNPVTNHSNKCFPPNPDKIEKIEPRLGSNACFSPESGKVDPGSASVDVDPESKQLNMNPRRQSTRKRPLTTRALESLQCDFLHETKKQKHNRAYIEGIAFSSPSRRARSKIKATSSSNGVRKRLTEAKQETNTNEACNSKLITELPPS